MRRYFNITGPCKPARHYMVNIENRLAKMKKMIDRGDYFVINRARQYGKTTTLQILCDYLKHDYNVISLDFQALSHADFETERSFIRGFAGILLKNALKTEKILPDIKTQLEKFSTDKIENANFHLLFECLHEWCEKSEKPIVLLIDEIDSAGNNQVFLDFLAQMRLCYIQKEEKETFQSVILAGVYDIRNLREKVRQDKEHKTNSPWNIAAPFDVDMSFSMEEIADMLCDYEKDHATGMNITELAQLLYDYTSGYPYLVSKLCQLIDEKLAGTKEYPDESAAWTRNGFLEAVKYLLKEKNTLFESLVNKLNDYKELKEILHALLFCGRSISYNIFNPAIDIAAMFGFVKEENGMVVVANRIFETMLYNMFLSLDEGKNLEIYNEAFEDKNSFIREGHLNMELILEKFVNHFHEIYGDRPDSFVEEDGRRYFLLYLRPIINGTGNYYIEAQTRDRKRTDVIVDYKGEQFVIEMKIWRGNTYHEQGEEQILEYLEYYHLKKGYMLSFNFNQKKEIGVKTVHIGERVLIEAVV